MKMKKDNVIIECTSLTRNIWLREGFEEVEEESEVSYADMKRIAKENGINSHGMNKEALLEAIKEYI